MTRKCEHRKPLHDVRDGKSGVLGTINDTAGAADDTTARGGVMGRRIGTRTVGKDEGNTLDGRVGGGGDSALRWYRMDLASGFSLSSRSGWVCSSSWPRPVKVHASERSHPSEPKRPTEPGAQPSPLCPPWFSSFHQSHQQ